MVPGIRQLDETLLLHLKKNPADSVKQLGKLEKFLLDRGCTFRGVAMPFLLKPNFISAKQTEILAGAVEKMSVILDKFVAYYLGSQEVRQIMKFSDTENELFFADPGYQRPIVISRLDAFLREYDVKFLEFNCDSPAGIAYSDIMEEGFQELFGSWPFMQDWNVHTIYRQDLLLGSLLECYAQFRSSKPGFPEKPRIAIVDWADVSTYSEFELHQLHFESRGYETIITSPKQLKYDRGKAMAGDVQVHLIYRRVITRELLAIRDELKEFTDLIKEGAACCCNSFRSYIVGNKKVLSILTNPDHQAIFSKNEIGFIKQTVPWTQILSFSKALFRGKEVDLPEFIQNNRELLVLKPANMYGGKDVYIGKATDAATWEKIMNRHIEDESWVVQEYIDIPDGSFPDIDDGVELNEKYININPFALLGRYSGTITRVSEHPVINVSAGGGLVPTFTAEKREAD